LLFLKADDKIRICTGDCAYLSSEEVFGLPNIKSAKKRVLVTSVKNLNNRMAKTALKTLLKKFDVACADGDAATAEKARAAAVKAVDKAAARGLIHKNKAANKKSKMAIRVKKIA